MARVVLLVCVCSAMLAAAVSLKCYSCTAGSAQGCEEVQQCSPGEDTCLKLKDKATGTVYSKCLRFSDCDMDKLALFFRLSTVNFNCCQSDLCNSAHSAQSMPLIGLMTALAVLWFSYC